MNMKIDSVCKDFVHQAFFNLVFQSRQRFHRKNDDFKAVANATVMFKIT